MESLEPDKMDKLLEAWEGMSQGMSSSLSNALLEGEQGLDGFLSRMLNKLASAALEAAIVAPFLNMLGMGGVGGGLIGGIGSILGFADGGSPPVGVPSIVGERGPELFVPKVAGTIIPNHAMAGGGGSTVFNIKQDLHFDVGLESVDSRIASAAPIIAQATEAQILDKQRRGRR
jgi:phage-related minor tail protein